jgi:hypothetical protein
MRIWEDNIDFWKLDWTLVGYFILRIGNSAELF